MTATLTFGYLLDSKSYPNDRVLYIVVYTNQQRSRGMVFSIFLDQEAAQEIFNIQNNAEFVRSTKEGAAFRKEGVDFVDVGIRWEECGHRNTLQRRSRELASGRQSRCH